MKNFFRKLYWKIRFWIRLLFLSPGVMVHELAHAFFCVISGVKIFKIKLFQFSEVAGYVEHSAPKNLISAFLISFGPIFLNTILAFFIFKQINFSPFLNFSEISYSIIQLNDWIKILMNVFGDWKNLLFLYLGISVSLSAIPSDQDGKSFGEYIKNKVKRNFLFFPIFIFFPFVWILNLLNYLKKFKIEYLFVVLIFHLAIFF